MANDSSDNPNKTDHDQPGGVRGTHVEPGQTGITNRPQEEADRQSKVVHEGEQVQAGR